MISPDEGNCVVKKLELLRFKFWLVWTIWDLLANSKSIVTEPGEMVRLGEIVRLQRFHCATELYM